MTLTERIKNMREHAGKTQKEMANFLGIASRTWQNYEEGVHEPSWKVLERLAGLGFNANWILTGEGPMYLEEEDRKGLEVKEAHTALRHTLSIKRQTHDLDNLITYRFPENARLTSNELDRYLSGAFNLSKEQLTELCRFAGGDYSEDSFIKLITESINNKVQKSLDIELLKLSIEIADEVKGVDGPLPISEKAELISLVYYMNKDTNYSKERIRRFVEAICTFAEQGIDFSKLSERGWSNMIIQIAQHMVRGEK